MSAIALVTFLTVIAFSEPLCHRHQDNSVKQSADYANHVFQTVADAVKNVDNKIQQNCQKHNNGATEETFEPTRYSLQTPLTDFEAKDVKVEIRHRVLYIKANKSDPPKNYTEIRELPGIVNTQGGQHSLTDGVLKIGFPLKNTTSCIDDIKDEVISVPVFEMSGFELRFGDD